MVFKVFVCYIQYLGHLRILLLIVGHIFLFLYMS